MPRSWAIWAIGRPVVRTSSTASCLNSLVNSRRARGCFLWFSCCSAIGTSSSHRRCPASGGNLSVVEEGGGAVADDAGVVLVLHPDDHHLADGAGPGLEP